MTSIDWYGPSGQCEECGWHYTEPDRDLGEILDADRLGEVVAGVNEHNDRRHHGKRPWVIIERTMGGPFVAQLTAGQLEGVACTVCGETAGGMALVGMGPEGQVFAHKRCDRW